MPHASRALAGALVASFLLVPTLPAGALNPHGTFRDEVLVAVLDTGIDPGHPEIDMSRVVAWWDFGTDGRRLPDPGEAWDPQSEPFDGHGHGTAVASLVAGRTLGAYPGAKLAVARLDNGEGGIVNADAAMRWAASLGADVVSMSFGTLVPMPAAFSDGDEAARDLARAGALGVVAAGNGLLNYGVRFPSETSNPASSPEVLVVGATGERPTLTHAFFSNTDPDVVAFGVDVCVARAAGTEMARPDVTCAGGDARYGVASGTSFATPLVAGWTAKALAEAVAAGREPTARELREAVMHTARDTASPYVFEGFGVVDAGTAAAAAQALAAGAVPPPNSQANAAAHEAAVALRRAWTETAEPPTGLLVPRGSAGEGTLAVSVAAVRDADVYALELPAGAKVVVEAAFEASKGDLDVVVYAPGRAVPLLRGGEDEVASGRTWAQSPERAAFVAPEAGVYEVVVEAWWAPQAMSYTLSVRVDGSAADPAFLGDHAAFAGRVLA